MYGRSSASASRNAIVRFSASARRRAVSRSRGLEEIGDVVGGRDFAPASRGGERSVAVAGGDIEDARAGADVERFAEIFADRLEGGADDGVVAGGPGELNRPGYFRRATPVQRDGSL